MFEHTQDLKLLEKVLLILVFACLYIVLNSNRTGHVLALVDLAVATLADQLQQLYFPLLDYKLQVPSQFQKLVQFSDLHATLFVPSTAGSLLTYQVGDVGVADCLAL